MVSLGVIPDSEIIDALRKTLNEGGKKASAEALLHAAQAIGGFPFMMQLVGYQAWEADPSSDELTTSDFEYGKELARDEIRERIFEATCRDLSEGDLRFARAMLEDEGESKVSDIADRLGWSVSQASQYRRRLMDAGVIRSERTGFVAFDLPFFREFLAEG